MKTDIKDPAEVVDASFDFTKDLGAAAIVAGSPAVTIALSTGADANPAAMLLGAPTLQGAIVFQRVQLGVDKADYRLRCQVTLNDGRVLVLAMGLPVRTV